MVIDFQKLKKEVETLRKKVKKKKKKDLMNKLTKMIKSKRVLRPSKSTLVIENKEVESVLNDTNRFFNNEFDRTKKEMFFR